MTCAAGTAARMAASAASMVAATVARSVDGGQRDLRANQQLVGTQVLGAQVDHAVDVVGLLERGPNGLVLVFGGALTDQQAVHLDHQDHGDRAEQDTDGDGADAVPHRITGEHRQADAGQREDQADQGAGVLQQHHRQLRVARVRMNRHQLPDPSAAAIPPSRCESCSLQADRHDQDGDRHDGGQLGVRSCGSPRRGEHRAEREQHQCHHERVEVRLRPYPNWCSVGPCGLRCRTADPVGCRRPSAPLGQHRRAAGDQVPTNFATRCRHWPAGRQDRPVLPSVDIRSLLDATVARNSLVGAGNQPDRSVVGRHPRRAPLQVTALDLACTTAEPSVHSRICGPSWRAVRRPRGRAVAVEPAPTPRTPAPECRRRVPFRPRMSWGEAPPRWRA